MIRPISDLCDFLVISALPNTTLAGRVQQIFAEIDDRVRRWDDVVPNELRVESQIAAAMAQDPILTLLTGLPSCYLVNTKLHRRVSYFQLIASTILQRVSSWRYLAAGSAAHNPFASFYLSRLLSSPVASRNGETIE